jgi:hypothetical protein
VGDFHVKWRVAWAGPLGPPKAAGMPAQKAAGGGTAGAAATAAAARRDAWVLARSNRKWMQIMILGELFFETIPQMCAQGVNNSQTTQAMRMQDEPPDPGPAVSKSTWDALTSAGWTPLAITSMAVSAAFVMDTIWHAGYCWHSHGFNLHEWTLDNGLFATAATWVWDSVVGRAFNVLSCGYFCGSSGSSAVASIARPDQVVLPAPAAAHKDLANLAYLEPPAPAATLGPATAVVTIELGPARVK